MANEERAKKMEKGRDLCMQCVMCLRIFFLFSFSVIQEPFGLVHNCTLTPFISHFN